jgi:hypothetical protein|tara:strand:- start:267 stop:617 length:351 start_codon:yes stop_codon:yes gene_type:complete
MALLEDPLELTVNNLVNEQTTQVMLENHMIVEAWLLDHLFHIKMVTKYLPKPKETNIIHKFFYQRNNNNNNFMANHHKEEANTVVVHSTVEHQPKLQSRQANLQAEEPAPNSGDCF